MEVESRDDILFEVRKCCRHQGEKNEIKADVRVQQIESGIGTDLCTLIPSVSLVRPETESGSGAKKCTSMDEMHGIEKSQTDVDREHNDRERQESEDNEITISKSWSPKRERYNLAAADDGNKAAPEQYSQLYDMHEMGTGKIFLDGERYEKKRKEDFEVTNSSLSLPKDYGLQFSTNKRNARDRSSTLRERQVRFCEMYEIGKSNIVLDRERHVEDIGARNDCFRLTKSESPSRARIGSAKKNVRVNEMYGKEKSKPKVDGERNEKGRKENEFNGITVSNSCSPKRERHSIIAGGLERHCRLYEMYEMGKSKIVLDRKRYEKVRDENVENTYSSSLLQDHGLKSSTNKSNARCGGKISVERQRRLCEMHELGKSKIVSDRERRVKNAKPKKLLRVNRTYSTAPGNRINEMYQMGKNKLVFDRKRRESQQPVECSSKPTPSNGRQNRLYALSMGKQLRGKKRREEVERAVRLRHPPKSITTKVVPVKKVKKSNRKTATSNSSGCTPRYIQLYESGRSKLKSNKAQRVEKKNLPPKGRSKKGTFLRLYEMSKNMREDGKDRREEIETRVQLCRVTIFSDCMQNDLKNW